jgi:hypothetical protein
MKHRTSCTAVLARPCRRSIPAAANHYGGPILHHPQLWPGPYQYAPLPSVPYRHHKATTRSLGASLLDQSHPSSSEVSVKRKESANSPGDNRPQAAKRLCSGHPGPLVSSSLNVPNSFELSVSWHTWPSTVPSQTPSGQRPNTAVSPQAAGSALPSCVLTHLLLQIAMSRGNSLLLLALAIGSGPPEVHTSRLADLTIGHLMANLHALSEIAQWQSLAADLLRQCGTLAAKRDQRLGG